MTSRRYAIYFLPSDPALADFGARWLGWDIARGRAVAQPDLSGLPAPLRQITGPARRYGFHATLKPPFRLAPDKTERALVEALDRLCDQIPPQPIGGLAPQVMGGFLALRPQGETAKLSGIAALAVETLDSFRAGPDPVEIARRRSAPLNPRQAALLARWGYPWVMEEFRFHLTLTGRMPRAWHGPVKAVLGSEIQKLLPAPFVIDNLCLVGEDETGRFHLLHRHTLSP